MPTTLPSTVTIPPKLRLVAYLLFGAAQAALVSWDPSFGHESVVGYALKVVDGLTALVLGVAASHVARTSAPSVSETPAAAASPDLPAATPAAVVASSGLTADQLSAMVEQATALAAAQTTPTVQASTGMGSGQLDPVTGELPPGAAVSSPSA